MWAEAALQLAEGEQERQYVARGLHTVRRAHNLHWVGSRAPPPAATTHCAQVPPARGNYPNEEFFARKLRDEDSGLDLRRIEDEAMKDVRNAAVYNHGERANS